MATVKKLIGRLPVYKGDWVAGIYSMLNQVSYLGSTFQSKIDNNTSQPATLVNNVLQVNSNWNVISNGTAAYLADSRLTSVEGKTAVLEQNVNLFNRRPQGLRFKSGDNTVFAKAMKALVLGTDDFTVCVVARTEGSSDTNPIMGFSNPLLTSSVFIATDTDWMSNGINWVKVGGLESVNWIPIGKKDSTTNLHHIVITRSGTLVKCIINGRLVKSVTQDRVLDFSNFIYDVANTSYFYGGSVYNYAMTEAEALALWNGGRYDEFTLTSELRSKCLLEYKPENIRVDRMINTGTAGSDYDLIYSLPTKPTIIYEAPYKDKIVLEDKTTPDFHPIAVGQRCYTSDGKILEAKLPAKGSEWQVSDWKLQ